MKYRLATWLEWQIGFSIHFYFSKEDKQIEVYLPIISFVFNFSKEAKGIVYLGSGLKRKISNG